MPARKQPKYYSTTDICEMLSVSRTRALEMCTCLSIAAKSWWTAS